MKLHRNAALSWNGRRQLAERVVVHGWTVVAAAASAGVSVRCARKWVGRVTPLESCNRACIVAFLDLHESHYVQTLGVVWIVIKDLLKRVFGIPKTSSVIQRAGIVHC